MRTVYKSFINLNKSVRLNAIRTFSFNTQKEPVSTSVEDESLKSNINTPEDSALGHSENENKNVVKTVETQNQVGPLREARTKKVFNPYANWPTFDRLDHEFIDAHTQYSFKGQLYSPFRWTPLIQKRVLSPEFQAQMRRFAKKKFITAEDKKELVDAFLFEALKDTDFDYYYDYECVASKACQFHGKVDFLIYSKKHPHLPFIPVFMPRKFKNPMTNSKEDDFNVAEIVGGGAWSLINMRTADPTIQYARVLHTDGNIWRLFELKNDGDFKKTGFYTPNKDPFNKIYYDPEMQSVILGLIRFACDALTYEERELRKVMDFVDEKKYLTELDPETKAKLNKRKSFWSRFLPRSVHEFFF